MRVNSRDNTKRFSEVEKLSSVSFFRYFNKYQLSAFINYTFQDTTGPHGDFFRQAARTRIVSNFNTWKSRAIEDFRSWTQVKNEEDRDFLDEDQIDRPETRSKDMFSPELVVDLFRFLEGHIDLYDSRAKAKNWAVMVWCELSKAIKPNENWRANNKKPGNYKWNDKFILDRLPPMSMSESCRPYRPQAKHIAMVNRMGPRVAPRSPTTSRVNTTSDEESGPDGDHSPEEDGINNPDDADESRRLPVDDKAMLYDANDDADNISLSDAEDDEGDDVGGEDDDTNLHTREITLVKGDGEHRPIPTGQKQQW
ncbi:hypothetical protein MAPG_10986 [Magnaporthiopsis poae ATCC 64411]|uniref:Uncharacterized protein n=1 Tax=Magnaporthiopsis poae (strain ATCC 64411 / 73-15) TaxID=644358 RepID=A0A0C4EE21_MAGP6|nr:hypothetical protein MAPG_10986 [Magnaporthiopsis poae ATCC 64411]